MYQQVLTDDSFTTTNGSLHTPVVTLADQYGGRAQIAIDDHCYVLYLKQAIGNKYIASTHWWEDVIRLVKKMPTPHEYEREYESFQNREW